LIIAIGEKKPPVLTEIPGAGRRIDLCMIKCTRSRIE
jgi:hypothetical protein